MSTASIRTKRATIAAAAALFAAPLFAGCAASAVPAADVEAQISQVIEGETGNAPDGVSCPEDLPGEEGAEMTCEITVDGTTVDATITVTSADGSDVNFDVLVDQLPAGEGEE
ncbi:DUF4333 domain-containing protein [Microbacterium halophytorum]|uniref:DUF4333 domain-containing protein n=1 Tax=Microbacterium halophytorum TaxID=2067568 RepID=UPI000CFAAFD7|nr:DUF4333 domain-containing protein [Microbacterium halophytorum]